MNGERKGEVLWICPEEQGKKFLGAREFWEEMVYRGWGWGEDSGNMVSWI